MASSLSAAQLQEKHQNLEGAPDPFPSIVGVPGPKKPSGPTNGAVDNSESAFPSLGAPAQPKKAGPSLWGPGSAAIKKPTNVAPVFTSSLTLERVEASRGSDGKPVVLGALIKDIMTKTRTKIEASTQRTTGATTFHIKGDSDRAVDAALRSLTAALSPHVTYTLNAPLSTIGTIIGPKGANLNKMREETGNSVKVDIPRREPIAASETPKGEDEDEEATVPITISGPASLANHIRDNIQAIVSSKKSKSTQRIREIPVHIFPFIAFQAAQFGDPDITILTINERDSEVVVTGEREAVHKSVDAVKARIAELDGSLESITMSVPKRQHRLFTGASAGKLLATTQCVIIPVPPTEPGDSVTVWGTSDHISAALGAVYEHARSKTVQQVALPGPISYASQIRTYVTRSGYLRTMLAQHSGIEAYVTPEVLSAQTGVVHVDFVGDNKAAVDAALKDLVTLLRNLEGALCEVEVDWLVHKTLIGRNGKKIKAFQEQHNVILFFPPESSESSTVLLVHDPLNLSPAAPSSLAQKQAHLDDVQKDILKLASEAADVKTTTMVVDSKWHAAIVGKSGTTLNAIVGEEKLLSIKVGQQAKLGPEAAPLGQDDILIRGPSSEVDRAVQEIIKIVDDAKNDEIHNGYTVEFDVSREYVGRIVGAGGSAINKIRDALGVQLDFFDESEQKDADTTVKKKKTKLAGKSHVKITGRKENVEEAKKRILGQIEKLMDETTEVLKIPRSLHSGLIGQAGKYVIRLEEKYSVKINFPRENEDTTLDEGKGRGRDNLKSDEVMIKGGKKGVAGAKTEILEAVEYEKESNNVSKFTVPTRAIARILGKGGLSINTIKEDTGAQIDVDKNDGSAETTIAVKGTKKAIAAAKEAILAISTEVSDETTEIVQIEHKYHRLIIGSGGQTLRDLVTQAGGPTDSRYQAGLVHFPRNGEPEDEVRLRGPKALVTKLKAALENVAKEHRDKVVIGVSIPAVQHRALIGRGGQHLNDVQARHGVTVQFPGSRSYGSVGSPSNISELGDVDVADLVKVTGPSAGVSKAIAELSATATKAHASAQQNARNPAVVAVMNIPLKYHHNITSQNNLFRNLRSNGVTIEQGKAPETVSTNGQPRTNGNAARIDDGSEASGIEWNVVANYQDAEEGESEWTLKGRDDEALEHGRKILEEAVEHAKSASHVGYLTLADRSVFPRIVGSKGANVARLRAETGADITVGREDNTIVIVGTEQAILDAKEAILKTAESRSRDR